MYDDGWSEYMTWLSEVAVWGALLAAFVRSGTNDNILRTSSLAANMGLIGKVILAFYGLYENMSADTCAISVLNTLAYLNMLSFLLITLFYTRENSEAYAQKPCDTTWSPMESKSIMDRLFFAFVFPVLETGMQRPLEKEDAFALREVDTSKYQRDAFEKILEQYMKGDSKYALAKAILYRYWAQLALKTGFEFAQRMLDIMMKMFIVLLVEYFTNENIPYWKGPAFVVYLGLTRMAVHFCGHQHGIFHHVVYKQIQATLKCAIYAKGFKTNSPKWETSEIINLFNQDVHKITELLFQLSRGIILPFQCVFSLALFYYLVGPVGFTAALIVLTVFFVFNFKCIKIIRDIDHEKIDAIEKRNKYQLELLNNIRILKMYNWESVISNNTLKARDYEMDLLQRILRAITLIHTVIGGADFFINLAMLGAMSLWGIILNAGEVFAGMSIVSSLKDQFIQLPDLLTYSIQAKTSHDKIQEFLRSSEYESYITVGKTPGVQIKQTSFAWPGCEEPALKNVDFVANQGEFIAVVGKVGTGKTTLLRSITGNINIHGEKSSVTLGGKVAYVEQEPWIQNASFRDNILFGSEYDPELYSKVLSVCELKKDIELLPAGDMSEIGEKGINLSGGQKARVSLARAVYKNTDILLLDDPLSAVDVHVGKRIFKNCLKNFCKGKCIIMVTQGQQYLPKVDKIVVLNDNEIVEAGTYDQLLEHGEYFYQHFVVHLEHYVSSCDGVPIVEAKEEIPKNESDKLVEEEDRATGGVKFSTYYDYFVYSGGVKTVIFLIAVLSFWLFCSSRSELGMAAWISASPEDQLSNRSYYIAHYALYSIFGLFMWGLRQQIMMMVGVETAKKMYREMIKSLLDAPMNKYFDITPLGRIINRFTNDIGRLDGGTFHTLCWLFSSSFETIFSLMMSIYFIPHILLMIPIILWVMAGTTKRYRAAKLELERIGHIAHTPIMQNVNESLSGNFIIRAFGQTNQFMKKNDEFIDESSKQDFMHVYVGHWLGFYTGIANIAFMFLSVSGLVLLKGNIEPAYAALVFYTLLDLAGKIQNLCFAVSHVELCMVPFERTMAFTNIPSEAPRELKGDKELKEAAWPQNGAVEFKKLQLRYRDDTEVVLKGIDMSIQGKEKIGICGRTGSGKSSLTMSLFRIVEALEGSVSIDGVDISKVGLDLLRQKLCLIPQDPTLFKGTMRFNLDPYELHTDEKLESTLKDVDYHYEGILDLDIKANGENLSVGQKQQICLARALLRNAKIMVLDEATASIDYKTDEVIQKVISEKFQDFTVLTIAHRINTIINYDKIACFDEGELKEFGTPEELLAKKGLFYELVHG